MQRSHDLWTICVVKDDDLDDDNDDDFVDVLGGDDVAAGGGVFDDVDYENRAEEKNRQDRWHWRAEINFLALGVIYAVCGFSNSNVSANVQFIKFHLTQNILMLVKRMKQTRVHAESKRKILARVDKCLVYLPLCM